MAVIVYPDEATCHTIRAEIGSTPDIEGGIGPVLLGSYAVAADGRCAMEYPWSEVDVAWLTSYLAAWPTVQVLDALPETWQWPETP